MGWPKIINFEFTLHLAHIINFLVPTNCPLETRSRTRLRSFKRDWCLDKFFRCWLGRMLTCLPVYFMSSFSFGCLTTSTWLVVHLTPLFFWGRLCRHLECPNKTVSAIQYFFSTYVCLTCRIDNCLYEFILGQKYNQVLHPIFLWWAKNHQSILCTWFSCGNWAFFFVLFWSPFVGGASLFFCFFFCVLALSRFSFYSRSSLFSRF